MNEGRPTWFTFLLSSLYSSIFFGFSRISSPKLSKVHPRSTRSTPIETDLDGIDTSEEEHLKQLAIATTVEAIATPPSCMLGTKLNNSSEGLITKKHQQRQGHKLKQFKKEKERKNIQYTIRY